MFRIDLCVSLYFLDNSGQDKFFPLNEKKTVWIKLQDYCKLKTIIEPSIFVSKLAYFTVGHENLATYCLKRKKGPNCDRFKIFPEDAKKVIYGLFNQFLMDLGCNKKLRFLKLEKTNIYLRRAINYSLKKIKKK